MNKKNTKNVVLVTGGFDPIHSVIFHILKKQKK